MKVLCEVAVPFSDQILRVTGLSASEFGITWMWKWWLIEQMSQKFKCIGKSSESLACDTQVHKESGQTKTLAGFQGITENQEWGNSQAWSKRKELPGSCKGWLLHHRWIPPHLLLLSIGCDHSQPSFWFASPSTKKKQLSPHSDLKFLEDRVREPHNSGHLRVLPIFWLQATTTISHMRASPCIHGLQTENSQVATSKSNSVWSFAEGFT